MRQVLVIDDDRINRTGAKAAIESLLPDCKCITTASAKEGIALSKKTNLDCILLDIVLPELDGFQVLENLKTTEKTKHIPVILISGIKKDTKSRIKALNSGADAFVSKPCDYNELAALIKVMFRIKDTEEKLSKQLSASFSKYKKIVDLQHNGIAIYDVKNNGEDFIFAEFNTAAERLENVKKENIIGKNVLEVFPGVKEIGVIDAFKEVYKTGKPITHPVTFYSGEGAQGWRENYIYKISSGQIVSIYSDVTQKKQKEERLKESELKYRLLADYNYAWEYWKNEHGDYNYVSPSCLAISGHTAEEFTKNAKLIIEIAHPECRKRVADHYKEEQQKTGEHEFEYRIVRPDGTERWVLHKCRPIFTDKGEFLGRRGINKDITEYKKAIESLGLLNIAVESSNDVIFMTNIQNIFTYVNPQFTKLYGYTSDEVVGKMAPTILDSGDVDQNKHKELFAPLLNKQSIKFDYLNKCKNARLVDVEAITNPVVDEKGELKGFLSIQRDVSERKRAEKVKKIILNISNKADQTHYLKELFVFVQKELGTLLDTTNMSVALYNEETELINLAFNSGKESIVLDFPLGKTFTGWIIRNQKSLLAKPGVQRKLIDAGEIEHVGVPAAVWLGVPIKVEGKSIGVLAVQDYDSETAYTQQDLITLEIIAHQISFPIERLQEEAKLKEALKKAKESDRLKSSFLASMSHELRTPLNAVIGFSSLCDKDMESAEVVDFAQKINTAGQNLLNIVDDIFVLSLLDSNEEKPILKSFSINEMLSQVYAEILLHSKDIGKPNVEIKMVPFSQNKNGHLYSDQNRIIQILTRLLNNALKFTHTGSIIFGAEFIETQNVKEWRFFVKDSGIGIPESHLSFIFDRFRMGDDSHTRLYDGLGIGLFIAKSFTELLGGRIWVESEERKGSEFYFAFSI